MVFQTFDHFWSCIAGTPTSGLQHLALFIEISKSEVYQFDIVIMVKQNVFWLQVSMHDADLMNVLHARYDLLVKLACFFLFKVFLFPDLLEQLVATAVLHNEKEVSFILNYL